MRAIDLKNVVIETNLQYPLYNNKRGKVRDNYDLGDRLLMVSTDRISAFDVALPNGIPYKGEVLNLLSLWWFNQTSHIIPNHVIEPVDRRSMMVKKVEKLPIEAVVRGYLYGSSLDAYLKDGICCGVSLPPGLQKADRLPYPIFTPTTKADIGHDEPMTMEQLSGMIGEERVKYVEDVSIKLYQFAREITEHAGIITADTKFEFGLLPDGTLILIDELLTPDSSRFWPKEKYSPCKDQESYDKQPVRDWLIKVAKWNKQPPAPMLPPEVVTDTSRRYQEGYEKLTGLEF